VTHVTHVTHVTLHHAILKSLVHDAIHGMVHPQPAQRTRMPLPSVPGPRTEPVASAGAAVELLQDVAETFTSTIETDITIHVTASQNAHIDREAGHRQDAESETHGTNEISTGGTGMIEDSSHVNMIPTLARQALQSLDSGRWTLTAAQALPTCAIFQVRQQDSFHIHCITPPHRIG